ncbi:MAG: MerC domain-containing protein [Flavobacteriaceae bacterium]|nr:MerC domain-containing protein [Flavobacteriaceae bacterium]
MSTFRLTSNSDIIGSTASFLCLVHCVATPFIFAAQAGLANQSDEHPLWWGFLDIVFLIISFFAVLWTGKYTSKKWITKALWFSWGVLAFIVLNEKLSLFPLTELAIYLPAVSLIVLHLYNRKYCADCIK